MKPKRHRELVYLIAQKASVGLTAEAELAELDAIVERAPAAGAPSEAFSFKVEDADGSLVTVQRGQRAGKTLADRGAPSEAAARAREALQDLPEHHECRGCRNRIAIVSAALDTLERELAEKTARANEVPGMSAALDEARHRILALEGNLPENLQAALIKEQDRLLERCRALESQLALAGDEWSICRKPLYDRAVVAERRAADLEDQLAARPALEWVPSRDAPNGPYLGRYRDDDPLETWTFSVDEMDDRDRENGWTAEMFDYVIPLGALPPAPKPPEGR
jgi:hypothetical protein